MPSADNNNSCATRLVPIWRVMTVLFTLVLFSLSAVGYNYMQIVEVRKEAALAGQKADQAIQQVKDSTAKAITEIRVNAATAASESAAIRERLDEMGKRTEQIAERTDAILRELLKIQKDAKQ